MTSIAEDSGVHRRPPTQLEELERRVARLEKILWLAVALGVLDNVRPFLLFIGG